jgi:hypothetical protein
VNFAEQLEHKPEPVIGRFGIWQEGQIWRRAEIVNPQGNWIHGLEVYGSRQEARREVWKFALEHMTNEEALARWPRLIAHMMCESLGYFTPGSAANALIHYKNGKGFWCEWYTHMAGGYNDDEIKKVGARVVKDAFERRHRHKGYMADYGYALKLVMTEVKRPGTTSGMLAGWF